MTGITSTTIIKRRCVMRYTAKISSTMIRGRTDRTTSLRKPRRHADPASSSRPKSIEAARPKATRSSRYSVQSLLLGLRVLEALAASGKDRGVTELAAELDTTKWRIFRHLHSLCEEGYASQDPATGKFQVGRRTYALVEMLPNRFSFVREARSEMSALRNERGHTVVLAAPMNGTGVIVLDVLEGIHVVQFSLKIGAIFDLHASAHGKSALAFGAEEWLEQTIARGLRRNTDYTMTDPQVLRRAIERIRKQGWSSAPEESFRGVNTIVAPVFSASRKYLGSIGIFGSVDSIPRNPNRKDVEAVVACARRISHRLGWK